MKDVIVVAATVLAISLAKPRRSGMFSCDDGAHRATPYDKQYVRHCSGQPQTLAPMPAALMDKLKK